MSDDTIAHFEIVHAPHTCTDNGDSNDKNAYTPSDKSANQVPHTRHTAEVR